MMLQQNRITCRVLFLSVSLLFGTGEGLSSSTSSSSFATKPTVRLNENIFDGPLPESVDVLIAGGGLGGLATCIGLRNRGIDAHVIEASPKLLRGSTGTGIMISPNGFSALDSIAACGNVNLSESMRSFGAKIGEQHIRMTDQGTGHVDKEVTFGSYFDKYGMDQYNIGWARAHEVLARAVPPEVVHTDCKLESFESMADETTGKKNSAVKVTLEDGRTIATSLLIGADGFGSKVRQMLAGDRKCKTRFNNQLLWNAILPTDQFPNGPLHKEGGVEFINCGGEGQAVLIFDSGEGQTAWYLTLMEKDAPDIVTKAIADETFGGFGPQRGIKSALKEAFAKWPMALECLEATPEDKIFERRQADRPKLLKWSSRRRKGAGGRVVLMGDAAHPMIPSLGQGTMVTWEDAAELAASLAPLSSSDQPFDSKGVPKTVRGFVKRRAKRCAMVQQASREQRMGKPLPKFFPLKICTMLQRQSRMAIMFGHTSPGAKNPAPSASDQS
uniref:FAD-binding domain-containing protein n=1 Tax=Corethron hystrix TaxID=216773 RepID=A0A6U5LL77_9STRA|mmetsp:Transcript_6065/g.13054  ORF Transcript_6065/g.13054 Transcript_6065/m.13054 type:complete len:500 (+) Transcript_6065:192-1691(+)